MKSLLQFSIVLMGLCGWSFSAEPLNDWLLEQVQKDEQLLADARSQTDGHSLELLSDSRIYIPFFRETPEGDTSNLTEYKSLFDAWGADNGQSFIAGGYIYRLRFPHAPPLYATSGGNWDGTTWHSLNLGKDIVVDPSRVWNGSGNDYLFATMLAGVPPKIVVYDRQGEVKKEETFNVNDAEFERRVAAAEQSYAGKGSPILEMLTLAEYLENPDALWREAALSGQFNLRNQQQRDSEREQLKSGPHLTRNAAIEALQSDSSPQEPQRTDAPSDLQPQTPAPEKPTNQRPAPSTPAKDAPSPPWWALGAVAALCLLWLLLKMRK